ncbi:MAG TPA: tryptophan 2,3-dioxygenase family protein [Polyangiaceae bacterium]|jgi:tryptophan 2,3-dioxygenase
MTIKPTPYWEYIRGVDTLLALQGGTSSDESELSNDEVMFIVVHQIDELWFKLALREMVTVRDLFARRRADSNRRRCGRSRDRAARIRAALVYIESYRGLPLLAWPREVLDGLTSFEQAFVVFRQRHARMVERMIGKRSGTGGSAGVDYLDQTALKYGVFHELWAVRTLLVGARDLPPVEKAELYGFARGRDGTP